MLWKVLCGTEEQLTGSAVWRGKAAYRKCCVARKSSLQEVLCGEKSSLQEVLCGEEEQLTGSAVWQVKSGCAASRTLAEYN